MIRFLADENFNNHIIRGIRLKNDELDIKRIQDIGLSGVEDWVVLDYALKENLILLTHDAETIPRFAYEREKAGQNIPAIFIIKQDILISHVIEEILLIYECSKYDEWLGKIFYLPI